MPKFDSRSSSPIPLIANEILKIMFGLRQPEEAFHVDGVPMHYDLKTRSRWTARRLLAELQSGQDVSLPEVGEALKRLHGENYIAMRVGSRTGFELTEKGRTEAERLGAKPA